MTEPAGLPACCGRAGRLAGPAAVSNAPARPRELRGAPLQPA